MTLAIEGWEDRSGQPAPGENSFGYVYFNDGSRVGYTGVNGVWQPNTNGGGRYVEVTRQHLWMAEKHLREAGVFND